MMSLGGEPGKSEEETFMGREARVVSADSRGKRQGCKLLLACRWLHDLIRKWFWTADLVITASKRRKASERELREDNQLWTALYSWRSIHPQHRAFIIFWKPDSCGS